MKRITIGLPILYFLFIVVIGCNPANAQLQQEWSVPFEGDPMQTNHPVVVQSGAVYVPWTIPTKLSSSDGSTLWRSEIGGSSGTIGVDQEGNVFAFSELDHSVKKLAATDGHVLWSSPYYPLGGTYWAGLSVDCDGNVYMTEPFKFTKLNGLDGSFLWSMTMSNFDPPVLDNAGDLFFLQRPYLVKRSGLDGSLIWSTPTSSSYAPCIDSYGDVFSFEWLPDGGRYLVKRNGPDGSTVWNLPTNWGYKMAFDSSGNVFTYIRTELNFTVLGKIDGKTGVILWAVTTDSYKTPVVDGAGNVLLLEGSWNYTSLEGSLSIFNGSDGTRFWSMPIQCSISGAALSVDQNGGVYLYQGYPSVQLTKFVPVGFVTGGGWITSPEGAYRLNTSLSGKANFGFASRYQKGSTIPTGNTEFHLHLATFNFKSSAYQWLVVAGDKAQFKGTGTINGAGNYKFLLTAADGAPDRFRIKIWDSSSENVLYDNALGASDTFDSSGLQQISGGGIVIHHAK